MKVCAKCKAVLPLVEFSRDAGTTDGLFRWCKGCWRIQRAKYYAENKTRIAEKNKTARIASPDIWRERDQRAYRKAKATGLINKEKHNARNQRYMEKPEAKSKKQQAALNRRRANPKRYEHIWRTRNRTVAQQLDATYIARLLIRTGSSKEVINSAPDLVTLKTEQVALHRLIQSFNEVTKESE